MTVHRLGILGATGTLLGIVLSGPLAVALVAATHPQPPWQGAAVFAEAYHPVQLLPYAGGIVLVGALIVLIASLHASAREEHRAPTTIAVMLTAVFGSFIFLNYVAQTTFLPALARDYQPADSGVIAAFSMANPKSLAWGIEMWGWGFLGVATWLVAPAFHGTRLERATSIAFITNGPVSIAGALWTMVQPGWVTTPAGLVAFALWNALLAALAGLALKTLRARGRAIRA